MSETKTRRAALACVPSGLILAAFHDPATDAEKALFTLGTLSVTPGVREALAVDTLEGWTRACVLFRSHQQGEWENHDDDDTRANWQAIPDGTRIFTVWQLGPARDDATLWIITEADRSSTTALLPSEY
jgi:hypothetical protein